MPEPKMEKIVSRADGDKKIVCPGCNGKGEYRSYGRNDAGVLKWRMCPKCMGSGKVSETSQK